MLCSMSRAGTIEHVTLPVYSIYAYGLPSVIHFRDWHRSVVQGEWNSTTAGGCQGSGFEMNTQYMLEIPAPPMEGMSLQGCICLSQASPIRVRFRGTHASVPSNLFALPTFLPPFNLSAPFQPLWPVPRLHPTLAAGGRAIHRPSQQSTHA